MKIYVGRWDLLHEDYEGYNGLSKADSFTTAEEVAREMRHTKEDKLIGEYTEVEFEDTFNQDINNSLRTDRYWIKIF